MLLGSEYTLLSNIATNYKRNEDGYFRFSELDYRTKFPEDFSLEIIGKLERLGFVQRSKDLFILDSNYWVDFFAHELQRALNNIGCMYKCIYSKNDSKILITDNEVEISSLVINFDSNEYNKEQKIINFCNIYTFDFFLFWLDLLNDINTLEFFYSFIKNEFTWLNYENRTVFNFFEGLEEEYISEIFNISLPSYFSDGQFKVSEVSEELNQKVKILLRKDEYQRYGIEMEGHNVVVVKNDRKIEFLVFDGEELTVNSYVKNELEKLEKKLKHKVSNYRKLSMLNKNKIIDNSRRAIQVLSLVLTPINALLLLGITLGVSVFIDISKNLYFLSIIGILLLICLLGTIWWIVIPAIKLSKFDWKIKY